MSKLQLIPIDKSTISVQSEDKTELQKLNISSSSSGCILCVSDGSLFRVANDLEVVEFTPIIKGSAKSKITPSDVLTKQNGSLELEGEIKWLTFMSYPQKLIISNN